MVNHLLQVFIVATSRNTVPVFPLFT